MKIKALDKSNCTVARPGGKEAGVKTTSPRTGTGYEAGDADELVPYNEVPVSASQVKPGVVSRKFTPLPGETCPASRPSRRRSNGTVTGNRGGGSAGVSSGHSSAGNEPGVGVHLQWGALKDPDGLTHAKDQTDRGRGDRGCLPTGAGVQRQFLVGAGAGGGERPRSSRGSMAIASCYQKTDDADYGSIGEP